jgi:reactive intermediate/imine deaminase
MAARRARVGLVTRTSAASVTVVESSPRGSAAAAGFGWRPVPSPPGWPDRQATVRRGAGADTVYCSSGEPKDSATGKLVGGSVELQAERCLQNLELACAAAACDLSRAVKLTIYLTDLGNLEKVNEIAARYFMTLPARAAVEAAALPKGVAVEIDGVFARNKAGAPA